MPLPPEKGGGTSKYRNYSLTCLKAIGVGVGLGLGLGGVEEKLRKRVEEKSRAETRLDFGSSIGGCSP